MFYNLHTNTVNQTYSLFSYTLEIYLEEQHVLSISDKKYNLVHNLLNRGLRFYLINKLSTFMSVNLQNFCVTAFSLKLAQFPWNLDKKEFLEKDDVKSYLTCLTQTVFTFMSSKLSNVKDFFSHC